MESIWKHNCNMEQRGLKGQFFDNMKVQNVVIGGGITGILTAYFLSKQGKEVIVLEAKKIAEGQTKNTTAKITSQHGLIYHKMIKKVCREKARAYAMANEEAIHIYEKIIKEEGIDCDFKKKPAYLYTTHKENKEILKKEMEAAVKLGIDAHFVEGSKITELPFEVKGALCYEKQAQFHPLKFIKHLSSGLKMYESTKVLSVKKHIIYTDRGNITAENIIFATHYPFINVPGFYFLRQHQERSYVLALEKQKELTGMYYSIDKGGLSLRSAGDVLLIGGGNHRTGKKDCTCEQEKTGYTYLRKMTQLYYPEANEVTAWSAQDCMPHDEIPFIGRYSVLRPYWYVATGFKKWGMTSAMIAAITICNQISGISYSYEETFTPQRFFLRASIKNLIIDVWESIMGLIKGLFTSGHRRCPHMGCRLEWNCEEASWDCPCHGSRFSMEGELQDNPAQIDFGKR